MPRKDRSETQVEEQLLALLERVEKLERLAGDSRELRELLESSEQKYRHLFSHSPSGFALHQIVTDEQGRAVDYVFLEVNRAFEKIMQTRAEDILGQRASELFPGTEFKALIECYCRVAQTREPFRFEHYSDSLQKYLDVSAFSPRHDQFATIVSDLTARKRTEEALRVRTVHFEHLFESSPLAIVLLDNDDRVVECNRGFEKLFDYRRREAQGQHINSLIVRNGHSSDASLLSKLVLEGELVDAEGVRYRKDGSPVDVRILAHPIHLDNKQIGIYGIYSDISRRKRDALTRLANRSTFMEWLERELSKGARDGRLTAVLALDLDHLKDVNDTYGLAVGDSVLQAVAERLKQTLRTRASIARLGGDEFGILQQDLSDVGNAAGLARRLLGALDRPFELDQLRIHVGASVGIAFAPPGSIITPQQLVGQAERALAQAKQEGHSGYKFHGARMDQEVQARMRLSQELHGVIDRNELFLEYQPQISVSAQCVVGVEALVRWRHPKGTIIGPAQFIPVAEASGVIVPIGDWVLRAACNQAVAWRDACSPGIPVAVNLSAVQFKEPAFADSVERALEESGLAPELLELELTESILVQATERVRTSLRRLQDLGVRLSLDDFGKGYSSLEYLRRLPLQKLKIDRSFVQNLEVDESDAAIVSAIIVLGSRLGLKVLAEGVERQSQFDRLIGEGCDEIQGFLFSPPVSAEKVLQLMIEGNGCIRPAIDVI